MDIAELLRANKDLIEKDIEKLLPRKIDDNWLRENAGDLNYDPKAINEILSRPAWDLFDRGGKRWRPLLMLLSCGAVGGNPKSIVRFAAIPEIIHNGSLIADDVEDNSELRRDAQAIHLKYGMDVAVNLSSLLYYIPLLAIKKSKIDSVKKTKIYEIINGELLRLHLGQGTDIFWHRTKNKNVTEKQYFSMCANKTGTLARLSAKIGAILGNGEEQQIEKLGRFAEGMGIAFQIQDDVLNLKGTLGKNFGEDITEGKTSLPVIKTLASADSTDKKMLLGLLNKHTGDKKEIAQAISLMEKYGSLTYSEKAARQIVEKAWNEVNYLLPVTEYKSRLRELATFMIERKR